MAHMVRGVFAIVLGVFTEEPLLPLAVFLHTPSELLHVITLNLYTLNPKALSPKP